MKILQIIPVHGYAEGVTRIVEFIQARYPGSFDAGEYHVALVDNLSDPPVAADFEKIACLQNLSLYASTVPKSLQETLLQGFKAGMEFNPDVVHVSETDAIPDVRVLRCMLQLYFVKGVGTS